MAMGMAVIGTNVGGLAEVIKNGKNGILVEPNDPKALAEAINKIYTNPSLWKELSENAKQFCNTNYSKEMQISKLLGLFKSLKTH